MRQRLCVMMLAALGLAGCGPQTTTLYYKSGMTITSKQKDYDACKIESFKKVPQNVVTTFHPGIYNPGTVSCYNMGYNTSCHTVGAMNIPPSTSSRDVNEALRDRFITSCMGDKGYQLVEFMNCKDGEIGYNALQKAPPLDRAGCYDSRSPALQE